MHVHSKNIRGFSLMEIVVASAILITVVVGVVGALRLYGRITAGDATRTQAAILVQEAAEALQLMRDTSWTNTIVPLAAGTTYYVVWNGSTYTATTTQMIEDGRFVRAVTVSPVMRDGSDSIANSGTTDSGTRRVRISIYRSDGVTPILESDMFLHNLYEE